MQCGAAAALQPSSLRDGDARAQVAAVAVEAMALNARPSEAL